MVFLGPFILTRNPKMQKPPLLEKPPRIPRCRHFRTPLPAKTRQKGPRPSSLRSSSLANAQGQQGPLFVGADRWDLDQGQLMMEDGMFGGQTGGTGSSREDPMLQMMQQLKGGAGGLGRMGGGNGGMGGLGGLSGPGMRMGIPPSETQQMQQKEQSCGVVEGITLLSSLCLAGWVRQGTGWSCTRSALERAESANMTRKEARPLFWHSPIMELILQSPRFFLENVGEIC
ncbi:hypothetical protein B9Z19DRAFT_1148279 [Tuber borchii]|uniref:Uncharacterized protein n=1 Tax=Tuber borchii TaxID=42251 RepID=A0A2T6ZMS3_TUBBO|nr:hypothetical protein B9Z19DRAFT_1148279 [Tuber borchii]